MGTVGVVPLSEPEDLLAGDLVAAALVGVADGHGLEEHRRTRANGGLVYQRYPYRYPNDKAALETR